MNARTTQGRFLIPKSKPAKETKARAKTLCALDDLECIHTIEEFKESRWYRTREENYGGKR